MNNKDTNVILSVIMPLFNVEKTLNIALDSILMQQLDYKYEIIAVDDASKDNTLKILQNYQKQHPTIMKIIKHSKNQGNAISFYDALSIAKGKYFCVLDGDDYYTVRNKLQKQISFLETDIDEKYVAVTHKYLRIDNNADIYDEPSVFSQKFEHTYFDYLTERFYFHTSTYMYRNIFKGCVPCSFKEELSRGDNPRTFMHLFYTKGKVKVLDFVGSIYLYNKKGIYSSLDENAAKSRELEMLSYLGKNLSSKIEREIWQNTITTYSQSKNYNFDSLISIDEMLQRLYSYAVQYFAVNNDFVFKSLYKSEFIDSFCETLGFVAAIKNNLFPSKPLLCNKNNILITISNLSTTGGGVYYEIKDIISFYKDKSVYLLLTDLNCIEELNSDVFNQLKDYNNLKLIFGKSEYEGKINKLIHEVINVKPSKIYHYLGHTNVFANAMIQSMYGKNICVFSFDHGFSLGLDNSSYDCYIAKRPMDYEILSKKYKEKVIYMPCWNKDKAGENLYKPFKNHSRLITACAAARFYKLSDAKYCYIDLIISLLKATGGKHIHYGPIPEDELNIIYEKMKNENVDHNQFVHIPWAENLVVSMTEHHVDIFIEPFPIVSYKITLDVLSAGIPIFVHKDFIRMGITDFIYPEYLFWTNEVDFIEKLVKLDKKILQKHSILSRNYFLNNHSLDVLVKYFLNEKMFKSPETVSCWDANLIDVSNVSDFWPKTKQGFKSFRKDKMKKSFISKLSFIKRLKLFLVFFVLMLAQIPIIDLFIRKKRRVKLKELAEKLWR